VNPYSVKGQKAAVVGLGVSGYEAALFLARKEARVFASEYSTSPAAAEHQRKLRDAGVEVELGRHSLERITGADLVVLSPGIKPSAPVYRALAERAHAEFMSEIELAFRFAPCEIIAVTGTNGKTTTTSLIAGLFNDFGGHAVACGNIGNAFVGEIDRLGPGSKAVVEVSSFQLENIRRFHPKVALLLNVTPDHFDWHGDMDAYLAAKARIFMNQTADDFAVLNRQDEPTRKIADRIPSAIRYFNEGEVDNPNFDAVRRVGEIYGLDPVRVERYLKNFKGIEHRLEEVPSGDGFLYINDSKSTNTSSLEWALQRMTGPVILLCGGRNAGNDFRPLTDLVRKKVKTCVAFGEARKEIAAAWRGVVPVAVCPDLEASVSSARHSGRPGDTILFSPACKSFDQFENYKHRGKRFKEIVRPS
jgi:UDP-N-acetylmuramoylalanine--D-glutamate ligase